MGKTEGQDDTPKPEEAAQPKKIIKKLPLFKQKKGAEDEELKDWKPAKITDVKAKEKQEQEKEKSNLAMNFLGTLPKPQIQLAQPRSFLESPALTSIHKLPKPLTDFKQTAEQVRLDAEEEEYVKKGV